MTKKKIKKPIPRLPIANKPNSKHKSKKDYDRNKEKSKVRKEFNG